MWGDTQTWEWHQLKPASLTEIILYIYHTYYIYDIHFFNPRLDFENLTHSRCSPNGSTYPPGYRSNDGDVIKMTRFFFTNGWDMFFSKGIYRNGKKNAKVIESQWKELSTAPFPHEFSITPAPEQVSASSTTSLSRRSQCQKWKVDVLIHGWVIYIIYIINDLSVWKMSFYKSSPSSLSMTLGFGVLRLWKIILR